MFGSDSSQLRRRTGMHHRGVSSVLSMMFLVIFGSLAATMAVVAQGNLRTAESGKQVSLAMSAAETGLVFASRRLKTQTNKFIVEKGVVDAEFAMKLWMGTYTSADGAVESLGGPGYGIVHAVRDAHLDDEHSFIAAPGDQSLPTIDDEFGTLRVRPIALHGDEAGFPDESGPYFRLRYELTADGHVRVTSRGVDGDVTRSIQMDFAINKRIEFAILSPNRLMIGKNVMVQGPVGTQYGTKPGELDTPNSHPLRMHSDFYHLNSTLDASLDLFYERVQMFDVSGDNRLRPNHPVEGSGLAGTGFFDFTGDGYVSDFDIFMAHYANDDGYVVYDSDLAAQAGYGSLPVTFTDDPQLARLIDFSFPDRTGDGQMGTPSDVMLGYGDGIIDARDMYAKVAGRLAFAVAREDWEAAHDNFNYQEVVQGPIVPGIDKAAVQFEVGEDEMRLIETHMFDDSHSWFQSQAVGDFESQAQNGTVILPGDPDHPGFEEVPYGSVGPYEFYERPIYKDITFYNVFIPRGTNALFKNCTFIGVTFIDTEPNNQHTNWNIAGALEPVDPNDPSAGYQSRFPGLVVELDDGTVIEDTRTESNNIRFHNCTFLGSISGIRPMGYTHWRNKIQMTGETRFYLDIYDPDLLEQDDAQELQQHLASLSDSQIEELAKSSILMPGWSMDVGSFVSDPDQDPLDAPTIKLRGTIIAGILDIRGNADVHGTLLMTFRPETGKQPLVFVPADCASCLAAFSTTIGYFGPEYGDYEGIDPSHPDFEGFGHIRLRYDPNAKLPDGIPWPVRMDAQPQTYTEGGAS